MPCNGLLISHSKHRERLLHASFSAFICAKLDELIPFARHLMHWLFIGMAGNKRKQINKKMSLSLQRMLILITIKNRLTYDGVQLTLKFLGSLSVKCTALLSHGGFTQLPSPSFLLLPTPPPLYPPLLSCLRWSEARPIGGGEAMPFFRLKTKGEGEKARV